MSSYDSDKAKMAAFVESMEKTLAALGKNLDEEVKAGVCSVCGSKLSIAWKNGRVDSGEPLIFCGPCYGRGM